MGTEIYLTIPKDDWVKGYNIDVSGSIEKNHKGLRYLSWSFAEMYLRVNFESLVVEFERDNETNSYIFGNDSIGFYCLPYIIDIKTNKRTPCLYYPILDSSNRPIVSGLLDSKGNSITLDVMRINTSLQRARTKIIAITTGIGFSLYNGEDLIGINELEKPKIEKKEDRNIEKLKIELEKSQSLESINEILNRWETVKLKLKPEIYQSGIGIINKKIEEKINETF